ncbi:hypothetical protein F5Y04DRAFT_293082 [Hypomontagnella monticulosa]|nr:hypothetical protein F5Y04DRAFT_293082 [Hypomontagnella monticulosa]
MTYVNEGSMTAIGVIFPVLTVLSLCLLVYGRRHRARHIEIDDILIIPAAVLEIGMGVALIIGAQMNVIGGHSYPAITPTEQAELGKFEYAFWIGDVLSIGFIKLSILFLFRRIFRGQTHRTAFDYVNSTLIATVVLWTVVFLFFEIFICGVDPSMGWSSQESPRTGCMDTIGLQISCAVFSWVLDLAILIEPLPMVLKLNMSTRRKAQLSLVFLCSIFSVVAGLLRMIPWIQIHVQDFSNPFMKILDSDLATSDREGIVSIVLFWTYVEIGIGFLVSSLLRTAWIFDQITRAPFTSKIRSIPSVSSLSSRWERDQRSKEGQCKNLFQETRMPTPQRKESSSQSMDDTVGLIYKEP